MTSGLPLTDIARPCPVCGGARREPFLDAHLDPARFTAATFASRKEPEFMRLPLSRCPACDTVYAPRPPDPEFLARAYAGAAYDSGPEADRIGMQAAEAIGAEPFRVLKTLMAEVDGKPVCVVVPSDHEVSMKKLAAAFSGKSANMMKPADAERLTGYHVGGISPFGAKKRLPVAIEAAALGEPYVIINAGQRGVMVRLSPADAVRVAAALAAPLLA